MKYYYKAFLILLFVNIGLCGCINNNEITSYEIIDDDIFIDYKERNDIDILQKFCEKKYVIILHENAKSYVVDFCEMENGKKNLIKRGNYYWDKDASVDVVVKFYSYSLGVDNINTIIFIFEDEHLLKKVKMIEIGYENVKLRSNVNQGNKAHIVKIPRAPKKISSINVSFLDENGNYIKYVKSDIFNK